MTAPLDFARELLMVRGIMPVPIPYGSKKPVHTEWQKLDLTEADLPQYFNGRQQNVGGRNGAPSNHATLDLDTLEAEAAAAAFALQTGMTSGRRQRARSHLHYFTDAVAKTTRFDDPLLAKNAPGHRLLEVLGAGTQVVLFGGHPSGDIYGLNDAGPPARVRIVDLMRSSALIASTALLGRYWAPQGTRNDAAMAVGGWLLRGGVAVDVAALLVETAARIGGDDDPAARARSVSATAARMKDPEQRIAGFPTAAEFIDRNVLKRIGEWLGIRPVGADNTPPADGGVRASATAAESKGRHLTDLGNAERLVDRHGDVIRYAPGRGWFVYDSIRWAPDDEDLAVMGLAAETARSIYSEAGDEADADRRAVLAKHATKSEQAPRIAAMVTLARSLPGVLIDPTAFDADPYLLNTPDGTVDLRSGKMREHRKEDYLSLVTGACYRPGATHLQWARFLKDATNGDPTLATYLQRYAGMCLTGDVSEKKIALGIGPTDSGKGTFVDALLGMMGDYARTADFSTFLDKGRNAPTGPRDDVAELAGVRLVISQEIRAGARFDEALIKTFSGDDEIRARFLYKRGFRFRPVAKLLFMVNHAPRLSADDEAVWNRIRRVPFAHRVPPEQRDRTLKPTLRNDPDARAAVLAWAIQGCLDWQHYGLTEPEAVRESTAAYRAEMDHFADFVNNAGVLHRDCWTKASTLRKAYELWCKDNGIRGLLGRVEYADRLRSMGCEDRHERDGTKWYGIGLRNPTEAESVHTCVPPWADEDACDAGDARDE